MKRQVLVGMAAAALVAMLAGCATVAPPAVTQITSEPPGATITLDGNLLGSTPLTATIRKKPDYHGPSTFSGTAANMREAFQQIERQKQMANYIFVAHKDGFVDARKELFVNDGLPAEIRFELQPVADPPKK